MSPCAGGAPGAAGGARGTPPAGGGAEVDLSPADFQFVRQLVHDDSAIALDDSKTYLVEARLAPIALREGLASVEELVDRVRRGSAQLRDDVVEAMATNETSFFRDPALFEALRTEVIPRALEASGGRSLTVWSAAAATGQEPYSVAMLVREHFAHVPDTTILATDLSRRVLDRARSGRFTQLEVNRGLPAPLLVKYFCRQGLEWEIDERVRRMVTFRRLNLARPFPALPPADVVLLRNVLIYFDAATKSEVLARVARVLRPGGSLVLGSTETMLGLGPPYERVQAGRGVFYRLRSGEEAGR